MNRWSGSQPDLIGFLSKMLLYFNGLTDTGLQTQGNRILFFFCHYKELITPWRGKQREWLASAQPLKWDAFPDFVESEYTVHNRTTADGLKPIRTDRARVPAKPGNSPSASILWTSTETYKGEVGSGKDICMIDMQISLPTRRKWDLWFINCLIAFSSLNRRPAYPYQ